MYIVGRVCNYVAKIRVKGLGLGLELELGLGLGLGGRGKAVLEVGKYLHLRLWVIS